MELKEMQLEQLRLMKDTLDTFITSLENDEVVILDGSMNAGANLGSKEEQPHNELYLNIEYINNPRSGSNA